MPNSLRQVVIASGGVAEELLPVRYGRSRVIITPITENCWVRVGATAAVDAGELVNVNSPTQFSGEFFPEIGGSWSVYSATTGAKINIREM